MIGFFHFLMVLPWAVHFLGMAGSFIIFADASSILATGVFAELPDCFSSPPLVLFAQQLGSQAYYFDC